jgi:hypothetical protein
MCTVLLYCLCVNVYCAAVLFVCKCALYYCYRVSTQLRFYIYIYIYIYIQDVWCGGTEWIELLGIETGGEQVWMWSWNFGFHKIAGYFLISWETNSFSRTTPLHGVSNYSTGRSWVFICLWKNYLAVQFTCGFGVLVVSMLASGTQDLGFASSRSRRIFRANKCSALILRKGSKAVCPMLQICGM